MSARICKTCGFWSHDRRTPVKIDGFALVHFAAQREETSA